jgi:diguanylate cyclase (GGDEF)-like protein/PAS domain S-box-containing protein
MRLTVRRKLLLLLAGTLTTALLLALALSVLIEKRHSAEAGEFTHALLHDIGAHIAEKQRGLASLAAAQAEREELIATLALLTDYAEPESYQPLIYDEEKKKLVRKLTENATLPTEILAYDGNGLLVAFGWRAAADSAFSTAISTRADGQYRVLGATADAAHWQPVELPAGLAMHVDARDLPTIPLNRLRRMGDTLLIEAFVPITRQRGDAVRQVGWLRLARPLKPADFDALALPRNMTVTLLFGNNFDAANPHGLTPDDLKDAPVLAEMPRTHHLDATRRTASSLLHPAVLRLADNETAWLVVAQDRKLAQAEQNRVLIVVLAILAASLLIALPLAGWLARRWIGAPLETLRTGAHTYAVGRLETSIELRSGDEFEALAEDLNLLAVALRVREIAIREAEERWQFALESAGHGVWDWNPQSGEVFFSPAWKRMLGYADDEVSHSIDAWRSMLHPDDLPLVHAAIEQHFGGATDLYKIAYRIRAKDGDYRWVLTIGKLLQRDPDGRPQRMIGTNTDITEQRRTQEKLEHLMAALQESEAHYRGFFTEAKASMLLIDPADGRIIDANPAASAFYGYSRDELLALAITDINQMTRAEVEAEMARALHENRDHFIFPHRLKNGTVRTVEVYSGPYHHHDRLILYSIVHDITERIESERAIREAATVFEASTEAIMITDAQGVIKRVNPAFSAICGYTMDEAVGQTPDILRSGRHEPAYYAEMWHTLLAGDRWEGEVWNRRKNGDVFPVWQIVTSIKDKDGRPVEFVSMSIDITQRKRSEAEIAYRANYDALTGLPNRTLLAERLGQALKQARRENTHVAVMFLDLDYFKQVNDTLGHATGDRLLQAVAERMRLCVRETDTIARQGGDEFVVLLADIDDAATASVVAEKIIGQLMAAFDLDGNEIHIGASIGITLFPDDGRDTETLFRNADLAMYRAKEAGRNNAQFFEMAMTTAAIERRSLEADLRGALARGEFALHYQPVVELAAGRIVGAEALLRWRHPQRGLVSPEQFVPLAEETGLIRDIGAWVFAEGCRQLAAWQAAGHRLSLALNVSVRQLPDALSVAHMLTTLKNHRLAARQIVLEITEGVLLADSAAIQEWFVTAGAAGLQLAIDDFGTGYSSLAYLKRFPVHHVKIDKAFVRDMASNPADRALIEAILAMAHSLGLTVVAEGVETAEQAGLLQARSCELAQGYFYSRPVPDTEFLALLTK